jgi:membrane peptidoglycan carboxypeptidase
MFDLTQVYSVFANSGNFVPLTPFLSITDSNNQPLPLNQKPIVEQVIPASVAFQISHILADPAARAPAFGYNSLLNIKNHSVAVKTGTTNNLRDNWTFGYTPNLLIATWVGNNDNSPMSSVASGITGASPIWARTMTQLLQGSENIPFLQPPAVVKVNVSCQTPRYEYFVKGTEPKLDCSESGKIL